MRTLARIALSVAAMIAAATITGTAGGAGGGPSPGTLNGWDGIIAPDGKTRYVALPTSGARTLVAAVRTSDGRITQWSWSPLHGNYGIPLVTYNNDVDGISANKHILVLATPTTYNRANRATTKFAAVRLPALQRATEITLKGTWAFDAISPNGKTIYAIQYASADPTAPPRYQVRAIDITQGKARPQPIIDPREPHEQMLGLPITRTYSPGKRWAYTLYSRPNGTAFIHALDTTKATARCIDLPWKAIAQPNTLRLTTQTGGNTIAISQRGQLVGQINLTTLTVHQLDDVT